VRALAAYHQAASVVGSADPACHVDWALLAAIGRVESNHARFGGNQLDATGVAQPGIIGIPLDGSNGTARILDTDNGLLDRDTTYDRAVGPMQFIPGTWRAAGVDGNADGVRDPQNMSDAAASTAVYLCSGPGDLSRPDDLRSAILRYNPSDSYVRMVTSIAGAYRLGISALPAYDLAPASPAATASPASGTATRPARTTSTVGKPGPVAKTGQQPKIASQPRAAIPAAPAPASSLPASSLPASSLQAKPTPTQATPATPSTTPDAPLPTCTPDPASTTSPTPTPAGAAAGTPAPACVPAPCVPNPAGIISPTAPTATSTVSPNSAPLCTP
jgi:hypothetical protein